MSYNVVKKVEEYQQIICNLISYILWLYDNKYISERTKNELLSRCEGSKDHGRKL